MRVVDVNVASHEAAHCLVMLGTGAPVGVVTVEPQAGTLGFARVDLGALPRPATMPTTVTGWQQVIVLVIAAAWSAAGPIADELTGWPGDGRDEAREDAELVEALTGVPSGLWRPALHDAVGTYLRANWSAVVMIASALLQRGTLHDADLRALVGQVPRLDLNPVLLNIEHHVRRARARAGAPATRPASNALLDRHRRG